jgi:plastocyanin
MAFVTLAIAASVTSSASAQQTITIPVGDAWFCAQSYQGGVCETVVDAGDTVVWDFSAAHVVHTTTECGASCDSPSNAPLWNSGPLNGGTYSYTFTQPGTYLYYCTIHPTLQRGRIVVRANEPSPTSTASLATPGAATATPGAALPPTGQGPGGGATSFSWLAALLAACATSLVIVSLGLRHVGGRGKGRT